MEAALAKLFCSVAAERVADETLQIRGGRGYEIESSLAARGETPYPVERIWRDSRINTIVEGTTDIMHLFIAREALDPHLDRAGALLNPKSSLSDKLRAIGRCATWYPGWYLSLWVPSLGPAPAGVPPMLAGHLRFARRAARRLARTLFHALVTVGPALERRQAFLGRTVDVGAELLAISAAVSRAASRMKEHPGDQTPLELAEHFCRQARLRIEESFRAIRKNADHGARRVAPGVLEGRYEWLEAGIIPAAACYSPGPSDPAVRRRPWTASPTSAGTSTA
jgi:hypothetical protein